MTHSDSTAVKGTPAERYTWQARPINLWVARPPDSRLLARVLDGLRQRLEARGCIFVDAPGQATPLGPVTHVAIGCWENYVEEISPLEFLTQMPKPRGQGMAIALLERIPDDANLFDLARGLLVRKSGHVGVVVEGRPDDEVVRRVLWASMAGNFRLLDGDEASILDSVAFRVQAHIGSEKMTGHDGDEGGRLTWEAWCAAPLHAEMAQSGRALGAARLIEDQVPLEQYGTGLQVHHVLRFLQRSALGEGMRSQLDVNLRVMGVTTTGGGKITLSPDPLDGQIVPISSLTPTGFIRAMPDGCPVNFNAPSVETHENGMVYLAGALINACLVDSFDGFLNYLDDHYARHGQIDILPQGMQPKATVIEHFHRQPRQATIREPERVEIVYPDDTRFPEIDFPCGVCEAELHLLSALFRSRVFTTPGGLLDKLVLAVMPGHGSVAVYGGPRAGLIDLLVNGMQMESVTRV
jgi:hypothetical protein